MAIAIIPPIRGRDAQGCGLFGASRDGGARQHNGVDFVCAPGELVLAFKTGTVTKLGYPYADKPEFRYVELHCPADGTRHRYFYVAPSVKVGDKVDAGAAIGKGQKLPYAGITQHYHFEVLRDGQHVDPLRYLAGLP